MKQFFEALKRAPKRSGALAVLAAAIVIPGALFAWGPDRPTFTKQNPADYVTFNSMTDGQYGDERDFVTVKNDATGNYEDEITVEKGKEYTVRVYVHNNAAENLNLNAINTTLQTAISKDTGTRNAITARVSADNAKPQTVYDDVFFKSSERFNLAYIAGSAKVYNNGYAAGGQGKKLSDDMVNPGGVKLGYAQEGDGKIPGCFEFINIVEFKVKPQFEQKADFTVQKTVRKADTKDDFTEKLAAKAGETVEYKIEYKNTGDLRQDNVVVKDKLPAQLTPAVDDKGKVIQPTLNSNSFPNGKTLEGDITGDGFNIGSYAGGANAIILFKATVKPADKLVCGPNTIVNVARAITDYGAKEDGAVVVVDKKCEQPAKIKVCELETKKTITIDAKQYDSKKHSRDFNDCKVKPVEKTIEVCELASKTKKTINESDFDASKHSKDMADCKETPVTPVAPETPVTPTTPETPEVVELPQTGANDLVLAGLSLGSIVAAAGYMFANRRAL